MSYLQYIVLGQTAYPGVFENPYLDSGGLQVVLWWQYSVQNILRNLYPSVYECFGVFFKSSVKNRRQIWENFSVFIKFVSVKSRRLLFLRWRKMCACVVCYVGGFLITNLIVLSCDFSRKESMYMPVRVLQGPAS